MWMNTYYLWSLIVESLKKYKKLLWNKIPKFIQYVKQIDKEPDSDIIYPEEIKNLINITAQ